MTSSKGCIPVQGHEKAALQLERGLQGDAARGEEKMDRGDAGRLKIERVSWSKV